MTNNTMKVRFLDTVDVPGHPRFEKDNVYILTDSLAQELLGRNVVEVFSASVERREEVTKGKKKK